MFPYITVIELQTCDIAYNYDPNWYAEAEGHHWARSIPFATATVQENYRG